MRDDATTAEKPKSTKAGNGSIPDFNSWMGGSVHAWENWANSGTAMMEAATEVAQEIVRFSQSRFQADIDAWKTLTACRTPVDLFECQRRYAEAASKQYVDEANKLGSRMIDVVNGAASSLRQEQLSKT